MRGMKRGNLHKKLCVIGPGGWDCPCCAPAKGKHRKAMRRTAKRKAYEELDKVDFEELTLNDE